MCGQPVAADGAADGAAVLRTDVLCFLGDQFRSLPFVHCRLSPLSLPLIPFRERTEALRIDINTGAATRARAHTP